MSSLPSWRRTPPILACETISSRSLEIRLTISVLLGDPAKASQSESFKRAAEAGGLVAQRFEALEDRGDVG